VYVWARRFVPDPIEPWALSLGRHFVEQVGPVTGARIEVERFAWARAEVDGQPHAHTFLRAGPEVRTAAVTVTEDGVHVVQGFKDLVILKSTGSAFRDFLVDELTTLQPTDDRIMATSLTARWRLTDPAPGTDWTGLAASVRAVLIERFANLHSLALQQTLWHMGRAVLEAHPAIAEIRLEAPNRHHFPVDLGPFGEPNPNEVFHADDRPYGLIHASAVRDDAPAAGDAWRSFTGLA
jgi:urate oxidase